ncbi:MAG: patatin-like phospholipase family protein [Vicinamibacterales bacterium]
MTEPREAYSPERRTALLFTGTGADGAYHAGVLRALDESGVKIDIVGGRGIGALAAVLSAVDGGARLWEPTGFWRDRRVRMLYQWRWPFRLLRKLALAIASVLIAPVLIVVIGLLFYPIALALGMLGLNTGAELVQALLDVLAALFLPGALPTMIPRLVTLLAGAAVVVLALGAWLAWRRGPFHRTMSGHWAWTLLGAPVDAQVAAAHAIDRIWHLLRGGAALKTPEPQDLSRRYAELLRDNLGQPGFKELLLVVHDLDARRDLVFGLVGEPYRRALFPPPGSVSARRAEGYDLAAGTQPFAVDALSAALGLPGLSEPRLLRFAPDAYWRGETHRITDRPACLGRLLEEAAAAGAEQVIVVSASPEPPGPHELRPPRHDGFGRVGEHIASAEAAALADGVRHLQHRFHGVYVIRPSHNAVRALDLIGAYDEQSDRIQTLDESMERGYEDAYRQFIEPVLGASGERMSQVGVKD